MAGRRSAAEHTATGVFGTRRSRPGAGVRWVSRLRTATAGALGAGIAFVGMHPLNLAPDVVGIDAAAWRVVFMPTVLLGLLALTAAAWFPARRPVTVPPELAAGGLLLLAGAAVSIAASADPTLTALTLVLAVSAPLAVFIGVVWSDLPVGVMAGCLIAATTVLLVRADAVFLSTWGVPTPSVLFEAKYTQTPYDFHYYTLGNPNHTAGWLLIAVTLSGLWVADRSLGTAHRAALGVALGVTALTLVLTYSRLAIATAIAIGVIALVRLTPRTRVRWATLAATALVVLIGMAANRTYLRSLFGTSSDATIPERLGSLGDGLIALAGDPFTGVGLGRFGPESGFVPAHSSIIQAAAEMGVLGLCALLLLSYGIVAHGIRVVRASGWAGLGPAAAVAVATYAIYAAFAASANEGLYSGYNAVWGLTAACVLGVSLRIEAEREPAPGRAARVPRS